MFSFLKESREKQIKNVICRPWSVRIEKNYALGLEYGLVSSMAWSRVWPGLEYGLRPRGILDYASTARGLWLRGVLKTSGTVFLNADLPGVK